MRIQDAIDREDASLINPDAFYRPDVHSPRTLFFDPKWEEKDQDTPTSLDDLETHYGKVRKILMDPYWAHEKCPNLLDSFEWNVTYPSAWEINIEKKPLLHGHAPTTPRIRKERQDPVYES